MLGLQPLCDGYFLRLFLVGPVYIPKPVDCPKPARGWGVNANTQFGVIPNVGTRISPTENYPNYSCM